MSTFVTIVVDKSGSTAGFQDTLEKSMNLMAQKLKELDENILLRVTVFDNIVREIHPFLRVGDLKPNYQVRSGGGTALYSATIESLAHSCKKMQEGDRNIIFLITDGQDCSSTSPENLKLAFKEANDSKNYFMAILIGVNLQGDYFTKYLRAVKDCGFDTYLEVKDKSEKSFSNIADYVSRTVGSTEEEDIKIFTPTLKALKEKSVMEVNGFKCRLHMPKVSPEDEEKRLPAYAPRPAFDVDEFAAAPDHWMHGSAKESSYFVPVLPDRGLWLDFEDNRDNEHHVAIVVSVQGINPITGLKSDPIRLEQYREKCPTHECNLDKNLICKECDFEWHPQNYLHSDSKSPMWIDGWRTQDGKIRQWYFTEAEFKGIAKQVIGEDRVYAIGIAFYKSKEKKSPNAELKLAYDPYAPYPGVSYGFRPKSFFKPDITNTGGIGSFTFTADATPINNVVGAYNFCELPPRDAPQSLDVMSLPVPRGYNHPSPRGVFALCGLGPAPRPDFERGSQGPQGATGKIGPQGDAGITKNLEIAAGTVIEQEIDRDNHDLDFWEEEPSGFIYINYCNSETAEKVLTSGSKKSTLKKEGFLTGLL